MGQKSRKATMMGLLVAFLFGAFSLIGDMVRGGVHRLYRIWTERACEYAALIPIALATSRFPCPFCSDLSFALLLALGLHGLELEVGLYVERALTSATSFR